MSSQNQQFIFNHILGLVQNAIVKNTDEDVVVQRDGLYQRMIPIIEAAALAKVNVLCFQEAWSKKFKIKPCIFMNFLEPSINDVSPFFGFYDSPPSPSE